MVDSREDIDLMMRFQNGEERCFEELVERHKQRVFNIAYRYLGHAQDAEDVAQQVFMSIYNAKASYQPTAQFTTWLYTICKNACLKTFRKKRFDTLSIDADTGTDEEAAPAQIPDPKALTPFDNALSREQERVVKEAIDSLPGNQRIVVVLYKYEELSYEEIAGITGLSVQAVKSSLHRARIGLKEKLAGYFCP